MAKYQLHIPSDISPYPEKHEITAAAILAQYFKQDATFLKRTSARTADLEIGNVCWEVKSPTGAGKRNIQHQFSKALKQSSNVVFDARRSKIHMAKIIHELDKQFKMAKNIKRLILITKTSKVIEFSR